MAPPADPARLARALAAFDEANAKDPRKVPAEGGGRPFELLYAERMTRWLERLVPGASEALRLAARCQHIERWKIPRTDFPMDRLGYHAWRRACQAHHAERAEEILRPLRYGDEEIRRVQSLLRKERLNTEPETQALEDVICLVFLEDYFADFALKHDEKKLLTILRKTWRKMTPRGREAALKLDLRPEARAIVEKAVGG